ncbi:MAG: DUF2141 domain-containing protein [Desulfobacterales bacterium]|nr:DUF2141 domain-containing protein [Desulfobacterales bacterium]
MLRFTFTFFLGLSLLAATPLRAQTSVVEVTLKQLNPTKGGKVKIALFDPEGFPSVGKGLRERDLPVEAETARIRFMDIPPGRYAVAVFQDTNSDDRLNKNLLGIPREPYGFSKNIFGRFGPPDFEDVAFEVTSGQQIALTIHLK